MILKDEHLRIVLKCRQCDQPLEIEPLDFAPAAFICPACHINSMGYSHAYSSQLDELLDRERVHSQLRFLSHKHGTQS